MHRKQFFKLCAECFSGSFRFGSGFPAFRPVTAGDMGLDTAAHGYPHILISDGRVIRGNLEKCGKTMDWLKKECRARGAASPSEVFILSLDEAGGIYYAGKEKR